MLSSPNLKAFSYNELKNATRSFRPDSMIGEGDFGCVFKGWIDETTLTASRPGSGIAVAIKQLKPDGFQGRKEWLMEVNNLGQLSHPNLVLLIGYCAEGEYRFLVYEFMPRGSLENHLFGRGPHRLTWEIRMKVAVDAAKGLTFLHEAKSQMIYRDFRSAKILLDAEYNAKLSYIGLAEAGPTGDDTHLSTIDGKSDVYSFVVLLELISGRRAMDYSDNGVRYSLVDWAKPYLDNKRKQIRIMDTKLGKQYPQKGACTVATLALKCLNPEAELRPKMSEVLVTLEQLESAAKPGTKYTQTESLRARLSSAMRNLLLFSCPDHLFACSTRTRALSALEFSSCFYFSKLGYSEMASSASKVSSNTSRSTVPLSTSSYSTGNSSLGSLPTQHRTEGEILSSPNLKAFNELKNATKNFRPDSLLGEGGFGCVFKGWIDETTLAASRPGSGIVVAVKKLKPEGFQGHKEWLTEVNYLGQLTHTNLVLLIDTARKPKPASSCVFLQYAIISSGQWFLGGAQPLTWAIRMKVAVGRLTAKSDVYSLWRAISTKGAYAAASLAAVPKPEAKLRPKMSVVLATLEQLEAAAKPGTKHTQMESPRARHSSAMMQKSRLDIVKIGLC
ncbi:hypothetical protein Bca52824_062808 [Brassica carinata]|uniref:non-specific serine/threonine protein kinase n=1 Tax=Brassica carinata TaxID=52824 RepID=A0A8X7QEB1_BRACI|nr:hypothetical protein Bca52824_062808 [Brassica carinata]